MRTTRSTRARRIFSQLVMLVGSALLAGTATAAVQVYQMTTGVWGRGDGHEVDVPFVGASLSNCNFFVQGLNTMRATGDVLTMAAGMTPATIPGFAVQQALDYGCLSGMGQMIVATAPGAGGAFTLPALALRRPNPGYLIAVPLPDNPTLIQAATSGDWSVPYATRNGMGTQGGQGDAIGSATYHGVMRIGGTMRTRGSILSPLCTDMGGANQCNNLAPFRKFLKSAWKGGPASTFNGQTGRAGADFTWCWGNPGCATIIQGTEALIVRYKAGPNRFGGTSNQIVNTGINTGSLFIGLPNQVVVNILDAGNGAIQVEGRGYADFITDRLTAATMAYTMVMVAPVYQMALHRPMSPPGFPQLELITMVTGPTPAGPPFNVDQLNLKFGFPLTTGTVIARGTNPPALGPPVITQTVMGGESVTAMGARNISLVAGSLSQLDILGVRSSGIQQMFLPEPSRAGQLVGGVVALLGVAVWRSRRARA